MPSSVSLKVILIDEPLAPAPAPAPAPPLGVRRTVIVPWLAPRTQIGTPTTTIGGGVPSSGSCGGARRATGTMLARNARASAGEALGSMTMGVAPLTGDTDERVDDNRRPRLAAGDTVTLALDVRRGRRD